MSPGSPRVVAAADDSRRRTPNTLRMRGIRKVFGGTAALAGVDFSVDAGEIHGLLGENGAGKSTLIKVLAGAYPADGGSVEIGGEPIEPLTPTSSRAAGVSFIHQDLGLIPELSVAENIAFAVGFERRSGPLNLISWRGVRAKAREVLARMGVEIDVDATVSSYGIGTQASIAIARALATDARILILDEPTATLAASEVNYLFDVLGRLRAEGLAIVFVSHRMDEVERLCDRVTVLRDGHYVGTKVVAETSTAEIIRMIIGHDPEPDEAEPARAAAATGTALELRAVEGVAVGPVDLRIPAGTVFGLAGLAGAGQHELAEMMFGLVPLVAGEMRLFDEPFAPSSPRSAIRAGLGFVPADRSEGLVRDGTLQQNLFDNPAKSGLISPGGERGAAVAALDRFDVRPPNPEVDLAALSGGNAQKLLLGKWFLRRPRVLILNEPTAGVDIGAREQIHQTLRRMAKENEVTIVVVSSDLEEVVSVCDSAAVLYRGSVSAVLSADRLTVGRISDSAVRND